MKLKNPHPGDILKEEFLSPLSLSQSALAAALDVPRNRIRAIINGARLRADIDLRLCRFFGLSDGYFLRLQNSFDVLNAKRKLGAKISHITPYKELESAGTI